MLTKIEKSLFGIDYSNQNDDARLKRIEETVYGISSSKPLPQRMDKLSKDLSADLIGQEIKPKSDTFAEDEDSIKEEIPKEDKTVDYPIVNKLEQKAFNQEYKNLDINKRLTNLEQKTFKKTYNDDLNSRVDRLRTAILPQQIASDYEDSDNNYAYIPDSDDTRDLLSQYPPSMAFPTGGASSIPSYNSQNSLMDKYDGNSDITIPLAAIEKKVFKKSYPDDTISNRLSRLELIMFNTSFTDDDSQTRIDRIGSAYQAKRSSKKYDSNKFSQHMGTAVQIGAILLMILAAIL